MAEIDSQQRWDRQVSATWDSLAYGVQQHDRICWIVGFVTRCCLEHLSLPEARQWFARLTFWKFFGQPTQLLQSKSALCCATNSEAAHMRA
jgi:hypothetical protein